MAAIVFGGPTVWAGSVDEEGFRTYTVRFRVKADFGDGPATVLNAAGLPVPGAPWSVLSDSDPWVWFRQNGTATLDQHKEGEAHQWWVVDLTASNKPPEADKEGCAEDEVTDPLLEPQKVGGSFADTTLEATEDRRGNKLLTTSHEPMRGKAVEFDSDHATVKIEQNVAVLELSLFSSMKNCVNDRPMWGVPARCVKLSKASWEKKWHGQCHVYFTRSFEFEVAATWDPLTQTLVSGFDRDIVSEGYNVLQGRWEPGGPDGWVWVLTPLPGIVRTLSISSLSEDVSGYLSVVFTADHELEVGQSFDITGANPSDYNGTYAVLEVRTTTQVIVPHPDTEAPWTSGGTASVPKMPDPGNPAHFIRATDHHGNYKRIVHDKDGKPAIAHAVPLQSISFNYDFMFVEMEEEHGLAVDEKFAIRDADPPYLDGTYPVVEVTSPTQVKVFKPVDNATWTAGGTCYVKGIPHEVHVEYYPARNFFELGIPANLELP
jgi:hypothetical protein